MKHTAKNMIAVLYLSDMMSEQAKAATIKIVPKEM
jgi:hypothetical protein